MTCQKICIRLTIFLVAILSVACLSIPSEDTGNLAEESLLKGTPTSIESGTEESSHVTPSISASTTHSNSDSIMENHNCSLTIVTDTLALESKGSLLFSKNGQSSIWAYSIINSKSVLLYNAQTEPASTILSEDGTQLLLTFEEIVPSMGLSKEVIIFDLENQEKTMIQSSIKSWISIWNWSSDGQLKYLISLDQIPSVGETRKYAIVTVASGQTEIVEEILDLSDYIFNDTVLYSEIASTSPNQNFVIYNTYNDQENSIVFRDLQADSVIWQHQGKLIGTSFPQPSFLTPDPIWGNENVIFSGYINNNQNRKEGIFSLTYDGQIQHLVDYATLGRDNERYWIPRYLNLSPNEHYINFGVSQSTDKPPRNKGPGFILDTETLEVYKICVTDGIFIDGKWISENQIVYRIQQNDGRQSLYLLDVLSWTSQIIFEMELGDVVNILGWTSIEFP